MSKIEGAISTQIADIARPPQTASDRRLQSDAARLQRLDAEPDDLAQQVKRVVEAASGKELAFIIDDHSEELFMQVTNRNTGEVIRQIPSKELRTIHARINEMIGLFFDKTA
jgi:flagellar protein FlaG